MKKRKGRRGRKQGVADADERQREAKRHQDELLERELEMGDTNARRLRKTWREKMMSLNLPVIKEDLQVAWHTFDRALDNKDYRYVCMYKIAAAAAPVKLVVGRADSFFFNGVVYLDANCACVCAYMHIYTAEYFQGRPSDIYRAEIPQR